MAMGKYALCFLVLLATGGFLRAAPESVSRELDYFIRDSVDVTGNKYISYQSWLPSVLTFVNDDGSVTVCAADDAAKVTHVYEYSADLREQKTLRFENERGQLGAFTKDGGGNYYFFYGENAAEKEFTRENMALVKYGPEGEKIKCVYIAAQTTDEIWARGYSGVKIPFDAGTCRLELSGDFIAVYFAREMFVARDGKNHQASYGFVVHKDTLERQSGFKMPSAGHSFNQFILPVDGGFVFADHGDAGPRSFTFSKVQNGAAKRLNAFTFSGVRGQNATYAEMGGLAKTQGGYIFAGTYGRAANNPRNVFVLFFDEDLKARSAPVYLTKYTKEDGHAGHPKIAALDSGRCLLLWERFTFSTQPANQVGMGPTGYVSTYMLVVNEKGEPLSAIGELPGVRLNINDTLRYNRRNGKAYWAVTGNKSSITLYALDTARE
jgi:hypothetical protein